MKSTLLQKLLTQPETIKLEFKQAYHLDSKADNNSNQKDWKSFIDGQWDELIKDIISLTNGNVGGAGQEAFLIIGASDQLVNGQRLLFDTKDIQISENQILQKVNGTSQPPIPKISLERFNINNKSIIVITIPPTPYVHETNRQLRMLKGVFDADGKLKLTRNDKVYTEYSAFIRKGENIAPASWIERVEIANDKKFQVISFSENIKREVTENLQKLLGKIGDTFFDPLLSLDIIKRKEIDINDEFFHIDKNWFLHISVLYFRIAYSFSGITTRFLDEAIISRCYEKYDTTSGRLTSSPFLDNLIRLQKAIYEFKFQYQLIENSFQKLVTNYSPKKHPNPNLDIPIDEIGPIVGFLFRYGDVLLLSKSIVKYLLNPENPIENIDYYPQTPYSGMAVRIEKEKVTESEVYNWAKS